MSDCPCHGYRPYCNWCLDSLEDHDKRYMELRAFARSQWSPYEPDEAKLPTEQAWQKFKEIIG